MSAHSSHLRIGRWSEPGQIYLVTAKTAGRRALFVDLFNGRVLVGSLRWTELRGRSRTWAFVVMPDHFHWLVQLGADGSLSKLISGVKSFTARQINERLGQSGSIWQPGFHDHALRREDDLRATARYVIMNPVRAGLARSVRDYPLWDARWI